jgi:prepilin-type N-terminal cleavage/methylation domain-containing protein
MKQHTPQRRGFTLVELLVVIALIMLLMTLVAPNVYSYWIRAIRMKCQSNIKAIATACNNYAQEGSLHRGSVKNTLPSTGPTEDNWVHLEPDDGSDTNGPGNAASLWLLIEYGQATPAMFLCPEASHRMDYNAPDLETDHSFTYDDNGSDDPRDASSTLSYSYLSLVGDVDPNPYDTETNTVAGTAYTYNPTPEIPFSDATTIDSPFITNAVAIVADMSPRGVEDGKLADIEQHGDEIVYVNSYNHDGAGQNVGRMDMSAVWMTDPSEATADNIFAADDDLAIRYDPVTGLPLDTDPETGEPIDPVSEQTVKDRVIPSVLGDAVLLPFRQ